MGDAADLLGGFAVVVEAPVAWGEMDAYGHVNNTVFFRYFESARIAYLEAIGFADPAANGGLGAILASTSCRFRRPLTYPDRVRVGGRAIALDEDRFEMEYRIVSEAHGAVAGEGRGLIVCYDYRRAEKAALPDAIAAAVRRLDGAHLDAGVTP